MITRFGDLQHSAGVEVVLIFYTSQWSAWAALSLPPNLVIIFFTNPGRGIIFFLGFPIFFFPRDLSAQDWISIHVPVTSLRGAYRPPSPTITVFCLRFGAKSSWLNSNILISAETLLSFSTWTFKWTAVSTAAIIMCNCICCCRHNVK